MRRTSVVSGIVAVVAGLAAVAPARAGVWTYDTCTQPDGQPASTVGWSVSAIDGGPGGVSGDENTCPAGAAGGGALTAQQNGYVPDDGGPVWLFTAPPGETIAGGTLTADLQAPQGEDWISTPGNSNTSADDFAYCAFNSPTPCSGTGTFTIDHPGGTYIYAVARCVNSNCPGNIGETAAVVISNAEIELSDSALPAGSGFSGPLLAPDAHGVAGVLFTASDPQLPPATGDGPGVYSVTAAVDGTPVYSGTPNSNGGACVPIAGGPSGGGEMFDSEQPCPVETSVDIPVDTASLANGQHDLTVSVTDAAGNSATVLDQEITIANPVTGTTTAPSHSSRRQVHARFKIVWKVTGAHTRIKRVFDVHLPARSTVAVECLGRRCPRLRLRHETKRHVNRIWRELERTRFRARQRLVITVSAPKRRPEPIELVFRDRRTPRVKQLKTTPR